MDNVSPKPTVDKGVKTVSMDAKAPGPIATPGINDEVSTGVALRRAFNVRSSEIGGLISDTFSSWTNHNAPRLGASLAFYTLLSLAPLLIFVIAIAGAFFGRQAAERQLVWQMKDLLGYDGAEIVENMLRGAYKKGTGTLATIIGGLALLYGASSVMAELRDALNTIWCVPRKNVAGVHTLLEMLKDRTKALGAVTAIGFLLLVSLAVSVALAAFGPRLGELLPIPAWALQTFDFFLTYFVIAGIFALMYKYLPDLHVEWRDVLFGAALTSLLFAIGKLIIGLYLGHAGFASTYGAAGSLVVLLVWVYYSAQIFFLGAEFTQVYAQKFGSRPCERIGRGVVLPGAPTPVPDDERRIIIP